MLILKYETYPDSPACQGYFNALKSFVEPIRVEEGCLDYQIYEWPVDGKISTLTFFQIWETEALLKQHMAGPRFKQFLHVLESLSTSPKVALFRVSGKEEFQGFEDFLRTFADRKPCEEQTSL